MDWGMDLNSLSTMRAKQNTQSINEEFYGDLWAIYRTTDDTTSMSHNQNTDIFFCKISLNICMLLDTNPGNEIHVKSNLCIICFLICIYSPAKLVYSHGSFSISNKHPFSF
eukprot:48509_1